MHTLLLLSHYYKRMAGFTPGISQVCSGNLDLSTGDLFLALSFLWLAFFPASIFPVHNASELPLGFVFIRCCT